MKSPEIVGKSLRAFFAKNSQFAIHNFGCKNKLFAIIFKKIKMSLT
jgi:hypothetical protein